MPFSTIILVPGLTGSRLTLDLGGFLDQTVWLSPVKLLAGGFPRLALPLADQPGLPPPVSTMRPGGPLSAFYGALALYLQGIGYRVVSPDGDWRFPLAEDGERLVALIRAESILYPVSMVCHSRGGLLARYALGRLASTGELGRVRRVACYGTPHRGSLNAVINLACSASLKDSIRGLGLWVKGKVGNSLGFEEVARVIRSWPSVYELLPDPVRSWMVQPSPQWCYEEDRWTTQPYRPWQPYLDAARTGWAALPDAPPSVDWLDIAGLGVETYDGIEDEANFPAPNSMSSSTAGDGTVVSASALAMFRRRLTTPCAHDVLPNDTRTWPYLALFLEGLLAQDVTISGPVLQVPL